MREAAGPRPAMAPPAAFIPPTLLLFIIGPAAPKEGENRRDPKTNFFPLLFSFPPPLQLYPIISELFPFSPPPPNPNILLFFPFFLGGGRGCNEARRLSTRELAAFWALRDGRGQKFVWEVGGGKRRRFHIS